MEKDNNEDINNINENRNENRNSKTNPNKAKQKELLGNTVLENEKKTDIENNNENLKIN